MNLLGSGFIIFFLQIKCSQLLDLKCEYDFLSPFCEVLVSKPKHNAGPYALTLSTRNGF